MSMAVLVCIYNRCHSVMRTSPSSVMCLLVTHTQSCHAPATIKFLTPITVLPTCRSMLLTLSSCPSSFGTRSARTSAPGPDRRLSSLSWTVSLIGQRPFCSPILQLQFVLAYLQWSPPIEVLNLLLPCGLCCLLFSAPHTFAPLPTSANGLVEHFHRTLKATLCTKLKDPNWVDKLPWVLLGVCTAPKEDLASSSAELVYSTLLMVPGDFIPIPTFSPDATVFLMALHEKVGKLAPASTAHHSAAVSYVPPLLQQSKFVFVWHDTHHSPLQRIYKVLFV